MNDLSDVIRAMRDARDHIDRFTWNSNQSHNTAQVLRNLNAAIDALQTAQSELNAHAANTTVLDAVEAVQ